MAEFISSRGAHWSPFKLVLKPAESRKDIMIHSRCLHFSSSRWYLAEELYWINHISFRCFLCTCVKWYHWYSDVWLQIQKEKGFITNNQNKTRENKWRDGKKLIRLNNKNVNYCRQWIHMLVTRMILLFILNYLLYQNRKIIKWKKLSSSLLFLVSFCLLLRNLLIYHCFLCGLLRRQSNLCQRKCCIFYSKHGTSKPVSYCESFIHLFILFDGGGLLYSS